jgi:AAA domain/RepB DNA-primase from phage plasmid/Primase C terminal 1 (PriCT-1)
MQSASRPLYQAEDLWHHIFSDERGLLHIWTAVRDSGGALIRPKSNNFNYPKAAAAAAQWALEQSDKGREVYFCAHLLSSPERLKENAGAVHTLWFEKDGGEVPNGRLAPSAVVESSPRRYHGYLRLTDPIPPEVAEQLNKRLAHATKADPSGADLTQLLRVPETVNHKYSEQPVVKVLNLDESRTYTPAELEEILPSEATTVAEKKREAPEVSARIVSGGRNKELTSIGGTLRRRGLEEEEIGAALLAVNERRCDPPLGEPEVLAIAGSVARYAPEKVIPIRDSRSRSRIGQDREDSGVRNPKNGLRAVSFAGEPKPPPRQFVVEGIVPAGVPTIVYGPSGIAKSFNILHLALSVAFIGLDAWHGRRIMTCPVIYLDFEMDRTEQLRRAQEVARGVGWPDVPKNFWYVNALGHSAAEVFDFAAEQLEDLGEALVVVDSFGFALAGESERSADVLTFMREQIGLLQMAGGHPLIVDHVARLVRGERAGNQDAFGSIYKKNAARSNIHVTGHQEEGSNQIYTTFTHKSTNVGPIAAPFTVVTKFAAEEVAFELSDEVVRPPAPENTADLIIAALEEHGPMTNKEFAGTIDRPLKTVQNITKELKDAGVISPTGEKREGAEILELAGQE